MQYRQFNGIARFFGTNHIDKLIHGCDFLTINHLNHVTRFQTSRSGRTIFDDLGHNDPRESTPTFEMEVVRVNIEFLKVPGQLKIKVTTASSTTKIIEVPVTTGSIKQHPQKWGGTGQRHGDILRSIAVKHTERNGRICTLFL